MEGLLGVRRHSLVLPPPPAHPWQPGSSGTLGSQRRETACEGQRGKEMGSSLLGLGGAAVLWGVERL